METIMMATDFSERSDRALRRITLLAKQHKAKITLIHVVDDGQPAYDLASPCCPTLRYASGRPAGRPQPPEL